MGSTLRMTASNLAHHPQCAPPAQLWQKARHQFAVRLQRRKSRPRNKSPVYQSAKNLGEKQQVLLPTRSWKARQRKQMTKFLLESQMFYLMKRRRRRRRKSSPKRNQMPRSQTTKVSEVLRATMIRKRRLSPKSKNLTRV